MRRELQAVEDFKASPEYLGALNDARNKAVGEFKSSDEFAYLKAQMIEEFLSSDRFIRLQTQAVDTYKESEENRDSHRTFSQDAYNCGYEKGMSDCRELVASAHPSLDFSFLEEEEDEGTEEGEAEKDAEEIGAEAEDLGIASAPVDPIGREPLVGVEPVGAELGVGPLTASTDSVPATLDIPPLPDVPFLDVGPGSTVELPPSSSIAGDKVPP